MKILQMLGVEIKFLEAGEENGGQWSLLEYTAPPNFRGPAPHFHRQTTEWFYILEGVFTLRAGETTRQLRAGDYVVVQPGEVHAWSNERDAPLRFLCGLSPAGLEKYFEAMGALMEKETSWPPADMRPVIELAEKYDTFSPPAAR